MNPTFDRIDRLAWLKRRSPNLLCRHYVAWPIPRRGWPSRRVYRAKYLSAYTEGRQHD